MLEKDRVGFFEVFKIKINVAVLHATSIERLLHLNTTSICQNGIFCADCGRWIGIRIKSRGT